MNRRGFMGFCCAAIGGLFLWPRKMLAVSEVSQKLYTNEEVFCSFRYFYTQVKIIKNNPTEWINNVRWRTCCFAWCKTEPTESVNMADSLLLENFHPSYAPRFKYSGANPDLDRIDSVKLYLDEECTKYREFSYKGNKKWTEELQ